MISKIRDAFNTFGPIDGGLFLLGRGLETISGGRCRIQRYVLVAQPVPLAPASGTGRSASLEIRPIELDEARQLEWPRPFDVIERRYRDGAFCLGAFMKGKFVGFQWAVIGPYEEDDVRTRFVPTPAGRAAWDFDIWVAPEYRLGRVFIRLWDAMNATLHARGVRWSISRISAFAPESLRSHARLDAAHVGSSLYVIAGPIQLTLLGHPPFIHLGMTAERRPILHVSAPNATDSPVAPSQLNPTPPTDR
ncbi:MAG: hypothetical protein KIT73_09325 [Burkholderiales bacterium]|nr:hypothetical protein [Burkholderiales bacterium]